MKIFKHRVLADALIVLSLTTSPIMAETNVSWKETKPSTTTIRGLAVTGPNRLLGEAIWDFGPPYGTFGVYDVAAYNPDGEQPINLTLNTPLDTLLATAVDPFILESSGVPLDPILNNIPLREVVTIVDGFQNRNQLPPITEVTGATISRGLPNEHITLKNWLSASGRLRINCHKDGTARIKLAFKKLIPNGVYTVWGTFGVNGGLAPYPLGGIPNVFTADKNGKAKYSRFINFCPTNAQSDDAPLLLIEVAYHSDGSVYGGVADLPQIGFPPGTLVHDHINFPINIIDTLQKL